MTPDFTCNVVRKLAKVLGVSCSISPSSQVTIAWKEAYGIEQQRRSYLLHEITRKMQRGGGSERARTACLHKFLDTEIGNKERNNNISNGKGLDNELILCIIKARSVIQQLIGETPTYRCVEKSHFTGGASTSRKRDVSVVELKYIPTWGALNCSKNALPFFEAATRGQFIGYEEAQLIDLMRGINISDESKWDSVPKDPECDRTIIIGNDCNVFLQRGSGIYIRERLKLRGIDLQDQSRNQRLAKTASVRGDLVTHDAVDSSNRIVTECVRMLLPDRWFRYLNAISERVCILPDGSRHELELFSSMGNGFTFELQSMIYFALAVASMPYGADECVRRGVGIFGDDVIIPCDAYPLFLRLLTFFGMEANAAKSYSTGIFRESCGGHYLFGTDATPFYIREPLSPDDPSTIYKFVNELRLWYYGNYEDTYDDGIEEVIDSVVRRLPKYMRGCVPCSYGPDTGFYCVADGRPVRLTKNSKQHEFLVFHAYVDVQVEVPLRSDDDLPWYLLVLWSGVPLLGARSLSITKEKREYRKVRIPTSRWRDGRTGP